MAHLKLYLDCRKCPTRDSGTVTVRIHHKGDTRVVSTGIKLHARQWDPDGFVRPSVEDQQKLNNKIRLIFNNAQTELARAARRHPEYGMTDFVKIIKAVIECAKDREQAAGAFIEYYRKHCETKPKESTRRNYRATINRIRAFDPDADTLGFEDITVDWLRRFDAFMAQTCRPNARAIHMRNIRAAFNAAITDEITTLYPFRRFKIRYEETPKRSLSVEQLRKLMTYPVEPYQERHRDIFMLTFMLIGINMADLSRLEAVEGDRINYRRAKTGRMYSIKVEPEAMALIKKHRGRKYLLNILDSYNDHRNYLQHINRALRSIGPMVRKGRGGKKITTPLFPGLTTYWARHTWATLAAELDVPDAVIGQALGHAESTVTSIYIRRNPRKVDEANRRVLDYVLYGKR